MIDSGYVNVVIIFLGILWTFGHITFVYKLPKKPSETLTSTTISTKQVTVLEAENGSN